MDLRGQRCHRGEVHFVGVSAKGDISKNLPHFAINFPIKIQYITLDRARPGTEGWIKPHTGNARQRFPAKVKQGRVNTVTRDNLRPAGDIGRGKTDFAAAPVTGHDLAGNEIISRRHRLHRGDIASAE